MKRSTWMCVAALGSSVLPGAAYARAQEAAAAAVMTAAVAASPPADDASFVTTASQNDYNEIMFSNLALTQSSNAKVRDFATRMVADHTKMEDQMKPFARKLGVEPVTSMDADHAAKYQQLHGMSAADFDRMYMQAMATDHHSTLEAFDSKLGAGDGDPKMRAVVKRDERVVKRHAEMADKLAAEVGAPGPM